MSDIQPPPIIENIPDSQRQKQPSAAPAQNAGGDTADAVAGNMWSTAGEAWKRALSFPVLRYSIAICLPVLAITAVIYVGLKAFGPRESAAPSININLGSALSQIESDRRLGISLSEFYHCLFNRVDFDKVRCLKRQITAWEVTNGPVDTHEVLARPEEKKSQQSAPPISVQTKSNVKKPRPTTTRTQLSGAPKKKRDCSPTLIEPNPCGLGGNGNGTSGGGSSMEGLPAFR